MAHLSGREYWDYLYKRTAKVAAAHPQPRAGWVQVFFEPYSLRRLWSMIGKRLPGVPGQAVLEIGCAPGAIVREFARRFGCVPHGVDFSEAGVDRTRKNFRDWGYPPENVVHADIFDAGYQNSVAGLFDAVVSGGFAEHFTDLRAVVEAHVRPLRPGGLLVITIPNYRGLNYWIGRATVRDLYPLHNFDIMNRKRFREGCSSPRLQILECGYIGGFDFGIFDTGAQTFLLRTFRRLQACVNLLFRIVPPPESRWTSPFLVCIARKLSAGVGGAPAGEPRG